MTITIIPFDENCPTHIEAVTDIYDYHVTHGTASFEIEPPTSEEMEMRFSNLLMQGYPIFVAVDNSGEVVGYAYAGPHKPRMGYRFTVEDSVYVKADAARQGIGRLLLSAIINKCRQQGFTQMLAVIGDSENLASIGLHQQLGFTHIGTAENIGFKFGKPLDVVYMQLTLDYPS